jgi:hypothetical protein
LTYTRWSGGQAQSIVVAARRDEKRERISPRPFWLGNKTQKMKKGTHKLAKLLYFGSRKRDILSEARNPLVDGSSLQEQVTAIVGKPGSCMLHLDFLCFHLLRSFGASGGGRSGLRGFHGLGISTFDHRCGRGLLLLLLLRLF